MQQIISHIEYLLDRHDCVTVPGFGAFIKASCPATIDMESGRIIPPHRTLTFNSAVIFDDGLLATSYSRAMGQPFTSASAILAKDIELLKSSLKFHNEVNIGNLGSMSLNDGTYNFTPSDSLFTGMGLPTVSISPVQEEATTETAPVVLAAPERFTRSFHGFMKYAAMLVILFTVGIILSTPMADNVNYEVVKASMSPIDAIVHVDDSAITRCDLEGAPAFMITEPETVDNEPCKEALQPDRFCLIVASLASRELADKFIAEYPSTSFGVIESEGRFRVFAATGPTLGSVMNADLIALYPGAWPCQLN
ncbi:MAG: hypothetical protein K2M68_10080 [Muribaculaceae bacterium]|nr:hypothetical protein [Muribaculaceae bacterium]